MDISHIILVLFVFLYIFNCGSKEDMHTNLFILCLNDYKEINAIVHNLIVYCTPISYNGRKEAKPTRG